MGSVWTFKTKPKGLWVRVWLDNTLIIFWKLLLNSSMQDSLLEFTSNIFKEGFIYLVAVSLGEATLMEGTSAIVRFFILSFVLCLWEMVGDSRMTPSGYF